MMIARVVGETVATQKHPTHEGLKLLLVTPVDPNGEPTKDANPFIAVDAADAGIGDHVLLATDGWAAMTAIDRLGSPIDAAVVGVIDHLDIA